MAYHSKKQRADQTDQSQNIRQAKTRCVSTRKILGHLSTTLIYVNINGMHLYTSLLILYFVLSPQFAGPATVGNSRVPPTDDTSNTYPGDSKARLLNPLLAEKQDGNKLMKSARRQHKRDQD